MKPSYYAVFQYDSDGICISFPDVPPALTCADNEPDGMKYAKEALEQRMSLKVMKKGLGSTLIGNTYSTLYSAAKRIFSLW